MQLKEGKKPLPGVGRKFQKKAKNNKNNKFQNLSNKNCSFSSLLQFEV
jgi:hypothetical protein